MSASRVADLGALADRALGAYLGLAIGDALGATVEFMTPREIAQRFASQGGLHRHIIGGGWLKLQPGQVTDDTTMSLALGEALLRGHRDGLGLDTRLIADAFVTWWRAKPVDCGNTCRRGILRYRNEGSLQGQPSDGDAGNGALMRNLPAALATLNDDAAFERVSLAQSHITHHNPVSDAAVLGLGHVLRALLRGADAATVDARVQAMVQAIRTQQHSETWKKQGGQFIPNAAKWINEGRWKDEGGMLGGDGGNWAAKPAWVVEAGFEDVADANSSRCYEHNAAQFQNGKRLEAA